MEKQRLNTFEKLLEIFLSVVLERDSELFNFSHLIDFSKNKE